jgi:hypothetical protein
MANDTDLWNDIEELEKEGKLKQAGDLLFVYSALYMDETPMFIQERLKDNYESKYGNTF